MGEGDYKRGGNWNNPGRMMVVRTRVGAAGMEPQGHTQTHLKVESVRPADGMAGCKRRGGLWCLRHEEGIDRVLYFY